MTKPKVAIILISLLAALQVVRVLAYSLVQETLAGAYSEAWLFPAMVDIFVGVLALPVAYALLKKRGLA
ncbi:MAG: hypothetical protein MN733_15370, partial [Nitrososphaera sp.]|nr:hypothetical protein [Nitrososphaera sp.]